MTTQTDVESVARSLTKAQAETLDRLDGGEFRDWQSSKERWPLIRPQGRIKIRSLGLVEESWLTSWHVRLTPLGLAVRDHLKGNQNGN